MHKYISALICALNLLTVIVFVSSTYNTPKLITALQGKEVVKISCGSAHSCAIMRDGLLYSWGKGTYGRLGHGMMVRQLCI